MKKIKFMMMALLTMMSATFTSCLDSDSGDSWDAGNTLRIKTNYIGSHVFIDLGGNTYIPTATSLAKLEKNNVDLEDIALATVYWKWVDTTTDETSTKTDDTTPTTRYIDIVSFEPMVLAQDLHSTWRATSEEQMEQMAVENAPIVSISQTVNGYPYQPMYYGAELFILPTFYRQADNKAETYKLHKIEMVYMPSEDTTDSMTFYLRHDRTSDTSTDATAAAMKAYDVENLMESFKAQNGKYPDTIIFKTKNALDGKTMPEEYTETKLNCSALNENYSSAKAFNGGMKLNVSIPELF